MSRVRLLLLSVLAVLLVSGVSSVSASAATTDLCPNAVAPTFLALCIEKTSSDLIAETGNFPFEAESEVPITSLIEIGTDPIIHIECSITFTKNGEFEQSVLVSTVLLMRMTIEVSVCFLLEIEGIAKECAVAEPIETQPLDGVPGADSELLDIVLTPESGTRFFEIGLTNNESETCPPTVLGKHPVTGEDLCWLLEAEKDKVRHLLECLESGSSLLAAEEQVNLKIIDEMWLTGANSGLPWTIELA